ncbi:hypothetical protein QWY86_07185 [Pedobacter aquatilis]|uniref:hypothetical protein n=1 Tax=Pedobacter aquatilis TaxID=351343 RepID=UPI0025B41D34|nr:hypothetical protein [Pedobacter aquatilis]MDN3586440.1 hypothetical protein [Pedobacter aquatilis]
MESNPTFSYIIAFFIGAIAVYLIQKLFGGTKKEHGSTKPNTMSQKAIQKMVDNYRNVQLEVINKTLGINDAHSVWFDFKTLKKFISDIELESVKVQQHITDDRLGLRFYYAAYPKIQDWDVFGNDTSIPKDFAEKHTLIMIPTLKIKTVDGSYLDYDFNPLDETTYSVERREKNQAMRMMSISNDNETQALQVMAQNHGQTIPPAVTIVEDY